MTLEFNVLMECVLYMASGLVELVNDFQLIPNLLLAQTIRRFVT